MATDVKIYSAFYSINTFWKFCQDTYPFNLHIQFHSNIAHTLRFSVELGMTRVVLLKSACCQGQRQKYSVGSKHDTDVTAGAIKLVNFPHTYPGSRGAF